MSKTIRDLTATDCKILLMTFTGYEFLYSTSGPENALFTLRAQGTDKVETPCLEWVTKSNSGILLISEPITRFDLWKIPDDIYTDNSLDRDEAERQIMDDFSAFIEDLEQAAYVASGKFGVNIKLEKSDNPRIYIFIGNSKTEEDLVGAIKAMDYLLPQLLATA